MGFLPLRPVVLIEELHGAFALVLTGEALPPTKKAMWPHGLTYNIGGCAAAGNILLGQASY